MWKRHARFSKDGTWDKVLLALQAAADARGEIDWKVSVDSTIARVHQHGASAGRSVLKTTAHTGARSNYPVDTGRRDLVQAEAPEVARKDMMSSQARTGR